MHWQTSRHTIDLSRPKVMGIVNVTPDSFSDGGHFSTTRAAVAHCESMLLLGAHILDIGGESSRPGIAPVPLEDELARVLPVLREAVTLGVPISVDTYKPEVMRAALDLGADIINDIWGLRQPGAREAIAAHPRCGVCLMHMHGEPRTMQRSPMEGDAVMQVRSFLEEASAALLAMGVDAARIAWDPGIGFGKTVAHNLALLAHLDQLVTLGRPVLVGTSRKGFLGQLVARSDAGRGLGPAVATPGPDPIGAAPVEDRLEASLATATWAMAQGARMVRVHDVLPTVQAAKVVAA